MQNAKPSRELKRLAEHFTRRDLAFYSEDELSGRGVFRSPTHKRRKYDTIRIGNDFQAEIPAYQGPYEPSMKEAVVDSLLDLAVIWTEKRNLGNLLRISKLIKKVEAIHDSG